MPGVLYRLPSDHTDGLVLSERRSPISSVSFRRPWDIARCPSGAAAVRCLDQDRTILGAADTAAERERKPKVHM